MKKKISVLLCICIIFLSSLAPLHSYAVNLFPTPTTNYAPTLPPGSVNAAVYTSSAVPGYLTPLIDPNFGTYVTRITDIIADGNTNQYLTHRFFKDQPWNADGSMIKLNNKSMGLLDGNSYERVNPSTSTLLTAGSNWSPIDANIMYGISGSAPNQYLATLSNSGTTTNLHSFGTPTLNGIPGDGYTGGVSLYGEGNISNDGRYVALSAWINTSATDIIVWDLVLNQVAAKMTVAVPYTTIKWLTMSQSGNYVLVRWNNTGVNSTAASTCQGVEAFTPNLTNHTLNFQRQVYCYGDNGDVGYNSAGEEVYVTFHSGNIYSIPLQTGVERLEFNKSPLTLADISCRNTKRPGYAYITAVDANKQEIFALKLDGSMTVERFANTHHFLPVTAGGTAATNQYQYEPYGVPNPEGTKVMFRSDWGLSANSTLATNPAQAYSYVVSMTPPPSPPTIAPLTLIVPSTRLIKDQVVSTSMAVYMSNGLAPYSGYRTISYTSSNTNVATINSSGVITAKGNGETDIYATVVYKPTIASLTQTAYSNHVKVVSFDSSAMYPPNETTYTPFALPQNTMPGYLQSIKDPIFNTYITRVTDANVLNPTDTNHFITHHYSKDQPWNADQSIIKLKRGAYGYLNGGQNGTNYEQFSRTARPLTSYDNVWSNLDPNIMYGVDRPTGQSTGTGTQFVKINALTGEHTTLYDFTQNGYVEVLMGDYEGNLSNDDKYVAFKARKSLTNVSSFDAIIFNIPENRIVKVETFSGTSMWSDMDWISVSPSGQYVVINWNNNGANQRYKGMEAYDINMGFLRQLFPDGNHGDLGYNTAGQEVYVTLDYANANVKMIELATGTSTIVFDKSKTRAGHVSMRNTLRPGWAYVTLQDYGLETDEPIFENEIIAVKLDGSQTIERFGHIHSRVQDYNFEAHAVPNQDGTKVMFGSDWFTSSTTGAAAYLYTYVISMTPPADESTFTSAELTMPNSTVSIGSKVVPQVAGHLTSVISSAYNRDIQPTMLSVVYNSSNPAVVAVNATTGQLTALAAGTANITANVFYRKGTIKESMVTTSAVPVNVVALGEVSIIPAKTTLKVGESASTSLAGKQADLSDIDFSAANVVYSSSNPDVVSINALTGVITALKEGTSNISMVATIGSTVKTSTTALITVSPAFIMNATFKVGNISNATALIADKDFRADVSVTSNQLTSKQVLMIVVLYNQEGTMIDRTSASILFSAGATNTLSGEFHLPNNVNGCNVKVMLWEGANLDTTNGISQALPIIITAP